jgi:hypothetical protein
MNPKWVVEYLTKSKSIPLSPEVQLQFVANGVDAATAKLLDGSSLKELGITSPLLQARVIAALGLVDVPPPPTTPHLH